MAKYFNSKHGKLAIAGNAIEIYVNEQGTYAEDSDDHTEIPIESDKDGRMFVKTWWGKTYIDEAVLRAFRRKPKFNGKEGYIVEHIDGDLANCSKDNLKWKELNKSAVNTAGHTYFDGMIIGKDGSIMIISGKEREHAQMRERWFDDDVNATWFFENPIMVTYEIGGCCHWYHPDEYMEKAGYIHGDKDSFKNPVVLHRDHDIENYNSDNLEWVESSDPSYIEYDKKRRKLKNHICLLPTLEGLIMSMSERQLIYSNLQINNHTF